MSSKYSIGEGLLQTHNSLTVGLNIVLIEVSCIWRIPWPSPENTLTNVIDVELIIDGIREKVQEYNVQ